MQKKFAVEESDSSAVLGQALDFIHTELAGLKLPSRERVRAELMSEETLASLFEHGRFSGKDSVRVNVSRFFGNVSITLTVPGEEFSFSGGIGESLPLDDDDVPPEAVEAIRNLLLRSFRDSIKYRHSGRFNVVTIHALRSSYAGLYKTLAALFLAFVSAFALKAFAPESAYMSVNDNILVPIRTVFLNGLKMCAIPIVFFSVVSCIADIGGLSGLRRTGGKLIKYFVASNVLGGVVGLCMMYIFRPGTGANLQAASGGAAQTQSLSLIGTLVNIVAGNLVRPFLEGNMLQIMMIAFLVGLAISMTDAKIMRKVSSELNGIFMKITEFFMYIIPLVMFCSMASMILTTGADSVISVSGVVFTLSGGYAVVFVVLCLAVKLLARLSPLTMLRKSLPMLATAFSTCSSIAAIPDSMKCSDEMGVPSSLYSLSVPLGLSLGKASTPVYYLVMVLSAANLYDVEVAPSVMAGLVITILLLSITTPAMPGSGLISLSVILTQAGCPVEFLGLAVSIEMLTDFTATITISLGNVVCTLLAAADDNLLDREKFNRQ